MKSHDESSSFRNESYANVQLNALEAACKFLNVVQDSRLLEDEKEGKKDVNSILEKSKVTLEQYGRWLAAMSETFEKTII